MTAPRSTVRDYCAGKITVTLACFQYWVSVSLLYALSLTTNRVSTQSSDSSTVGTAWCETTCLSVMTLASTTVHDGSMHHDARCSNGAHGIGRNFPDRMRHRPRFTSASSTTDASEIFEENALLAERSLRASASNYRSGSPSFKGCAIVLHEGVAKISVLGSMRG